MNKIYRSKRNNRKYGGFSSQNCVNDGMGNYTQMCPGVLPFLLQAKQLIVDDPNSVYAIFGHGCDLRNEIGIIPPNVRYITATACGIGKSEDIPDTPGIETDFKNNAMTLPITLKTLRKYSKFEADTMTLRNKKKVYVTRNEEYNIHTEGQQFVNNKNWCFRDVGVPSGLRKLGTIISLIEPLKTDGPQDYTVIEYFLKMYEGSLFPTYDQVKNILNSTYSAEELNNVNYADYDFDFEGLKEGFKNLIKDNFSIDFATLIDNLQGTFINIACRTICGDNDDLIGKDNFVDTVRRTVSAERDGYSVVDRAFMETHNASQLTDSLKEQLDSKFKGLKIRQKDSSLVKMYREEAERTGDWAEYNKLERDQPGQFEGNVMKRSFLGGKLSRYQKTYLKRSKVQRK